MGLTQFCLNTSANTPHIQHEVFGSRRQSCSPRSCSLPICPWSLSIWRPGCLCQWSFVPADTPEVYAAKVAHAAAGGAVLPVGVVGYPYAYAGLVAHPNGAVVPVEPADVVQARADHLAAHSA